MRKPYRHKFNMIFNNIIPSQSIDSMIFTKLILDCSIVVREDFLKSIDSHKVEMYSRKLLAELHLASIGLLNKQEATVIEIRNLIVIIFKKTPGS